MPDRIDLVTSASCVLRVAEGYGDLFWVEIKDGAPCGVRRHVVRIEAGGVVFGVPLVAHKPDRCCGLMVVAGPSADLIAVAKSNCRSWCSLFGNGAIM